MLVSYRQGLLTVPANFIVPASSTSVQFNLGTRTVLASALAGDKDYLLRITGVAPNNVGNNFSSNTFVNLTAGGNWFLWADLSLYTGAVTYGATNQAALTSANYDPFDSSIILPPNSPADGQMWWCTQDYPPSPAAALFKERHLYVYESGRWVHHLRVMLGIKSDSGLAKYSIGPQFDSLGEVGGAKIYSAGFLLTDTGAGDVNQRKTFHSINGELLTSASELLGADANAESFVKLDNSQTIVKAGPPLAEYTCVYMVNGLAWPASSSPLYYSTRAPIGIVLRDTPSNEPVELYMAGRTIINTGPSWDFDEADWGKTVYCDSNGALTLTKPSAPQYVRVGVVVSNAEIWLTFDTFNAQDNSSSGIDVVGGTAPVVATTVGSTVTISMPAATTSSNGYMTSVQATAIAANTAAIATKANISHTHVAADITDLAALLAGKSNVGHTHTLSAVTDVTASAAEVNKLTGATVSTTELNYVTGVTSAIQTQLNSKPNKPVTTVLGNIATYSDTSGNLADSGVSTTDFAASTHYHTPNRITSDGTSGGTPVSATVTEINKLAGLTASTAELNKLTGVTASTTEINYLTGVTGAIQTQLAGKAALAHTHVIANITGLTSALAAKLDLTGGSITGALSVTGNTTLNGLIFSTSNTISISGNTGSTGQALTSNGSGAITWRTLVPSGGTTGQLLSKTSGTDWATTWVDPPSPPAPAAPDTEILFGTGASTTTSSDFTITLLPTPVLTLAGATFNTGATALTITAPSSTGGKDLELFAGSSTTINGGDVVITSGDVDGDTVSSGSILISTPGGTGSSSNVTSGDITLQTALGDVGSGSINFVTGDTTRLTIDDAGGWTINGVAGTNGQVLVSDGSSVPTWTTLSSGSVSSVNASTSLNGLSFTGGPITTAGTLSLSGTLGAVSGGTGLTVYTIGDLLYADSTTSLARLAIGTSSYVLTSQGAGQPPIWSAPTVYVSSVDVDGGTTGLTFSGGPVTTTGTITLAGTLGIANGGTNSTSVEFEQVLYGAYEQSPEFTYNGELTVPGIITEYVRNLDGETLTIRSGSSTASSMTIDITTPGSGYIDGTYSNVPPDGGSGSGLLLDITIVGGQVTNVSVVDLGVGYEVSDVLTVEAVYIGGYDTGGGFSGTISDITPGPVAGNLVLTAGDSTPYVMAGDVIIEAGYAGSVDFNGSVVIRTANIDRLVITETGALAVTSLYGADTGDVGDVLTSQGPDAPPVWTPAITTSEHTLSSLPPVGDYPGQQAYVSDATGASVTGSLCFWNPGAGLWIDVTTGVGVV